MEKVCGRPACLPRDLGAIARALGALHVLPLPGSGLRPPVRDESDPLGELREEIAAQWRLGRSPAVDALRAACDRPDRQPCALTAFDAHPGNSLIRSDGRAILVDLEKARYAYPGLDLAHATLYTSTTWGRSPPTVLDVAQLQVVQVAWVGAAGSAQGAASQA